MFRKATRHLSRPICAAASTVGAKSQTLMDPTTSIKTLRDVFKSSLMRQQNATGNHMLKDVLVGSNGIPNLSRGLYNREYRLPLQLSKNHVANARSYSSRTPQQKRQSTSETKNDLSTVEDPFDSPTYHIPEKPVTFTEGASYSLIILAGLGIAAAAAYAVFKELIFEPKEYKIFNKALKRIQDDGQVRVRIGSPITGYGQESRNRAARQRIPNRTWTDEDGVDHVEVNFYIRGPHGAGKVYSEMFKDKEENEWKFTYLIVEIRSPSPAQLMLESYVPA